ncbi:MAG: thioesterase family protein [Pseudomonadota bacterium]
MNLYLRLLRVLLGGWMQPRQHYTSTVDSRFRVMPHDLDAFGHMNNGRYLQIMDVARMKWMLATGVLAAIRQHRWSPVLGGGLVRYRHSLRFLQSYTVRTHLLGWQGQWFFLEHRFFDDAGRTVAVGVSRAGLRSAGRWVPASQVANSVSPDAQSPELPTYVSEWLAIEDAVCQRPQDRTQATPPSGPAQEAA